MKSLITLFKKYLSSLWKIKYLSLTSIEFYSNVYNKYSGYGFKYLLTLSTIAGLLGSTFFLYLNNHLSLIVNNNKTSHLSSNIYYILDQFPPLSYNGTSITMQDEEPIIIKNLNSERIIAIDINNKITKDQRVRIPIILSKNNLIFYLKSSTKENIKPLLLKYKYVFGGVPREINDEYLQLSLGELIKSIPKVIIYFFFPIITFFTFFNGLISAGQSVLLLYLIALVYNWQSKFKDLFRISIFASAITVFIQSILGLLMTKFIFYIWILQIWCNFLLISGFIKSQNR